MKTVEIKKLIYKQNPTASFNMFRGGTLYYSTTIRTDGEWSPSDQPILFEIPATDIGATDFENKMAAKHLLRWIVNDEM